VTFGVPESKKEKVWVVKNQGRKKRRTEDVERIVSLSFYAVKKVLSSQ
jgi:hypothetical protein